IRGLHVMPNPSFPQTMNDLANGSRGAAAPDELHALLALPLVERSSAQFFRHQLDATNTAARMRLGIFRVAERTILHHGRLLRGACHAFPRPLVVDNQDRLAIGASRQEGGTLPTAGVTRLFGIVGSATELNSVCS